MTKNKSKTTSLQKTKDARSHADGRWVMALDEEEILEG
jgi:hypothetical protein